MWENSFIQFENKEFPVDIKITGLRYQEQNFKNYMRAGLCYSTDKGTV